MKDTTDYFGLVEKVIESSQDNTAGIVLSRHAIKKVFKDMENKVVKPLEEYETQRGYLVKDSDFMAATISQWKEELKSNI